MGAEALQIAKHFGPTVFLTVFVLILLSGILTLLVRMHKEERNSWRQDMQKMQESHRAERVAWNARQSRMAEKADQNAEKVTEKLTDILIEISRQK